MNVVDILLWAAGASAKMPLLAGIHDERILYLLGIDEEQLVHLLEQHRLAARFLARYQQERPAWCSKSLLAQVMELCRHAERHTQQQIEALEEIASATASKGQPLIVIKGCTAYALTGNRHCLRLSGDLDLFYSDLEYLWETLEQLGYTGRKLTHGVHEFAKLSRGKVALEPHHFFPIYAYPPGLAEVDLDPARNPGCWWQTFPVLPEKEIRYPDLLAHSTHGVTPETRNLTFPDATMAVFLLCVHLFKDYTIVPPTNDNIAIKLVELAEIADLTAHSQFDRQCFLDLVARFDGWDAVGFGGHLLQACLGSNPLPTPPGQRRLKKQGRYPAVLTWWKCWAAYCSAEDLLFPADVCAAIERLEPNTVAATTEEPPKRYQVLAPGQGEAIGRVLLHSTQGHPLPVALEITWGAEALTFAFAFLSPLMEESQEYHISLRGGRYFLGGRSVDIDYTVNVSPRGIEYWHLGLENACVSFSEAGCVLRMWIPWEGLPGNVAQTPSLPLLLIVALRDSRAPSRLSFDPVMVIPLRIMRT